LTKRRTRMAIMHRWAGADSINPNLGLDEQARPAAISIASPQIKNISSFKSHIARPVILPSGSFSRFQNKISTDVNRQAPLCHLINKALV
jgi:hypothetical protein